MGKIFPSRNLSVPKATPLPNLKLIVQLACSLLTTTNDPFFAGSERKTRGTETCGSREQKAARGENSAPGNRKGSAAAKIGKPNQPTIPIVISRT
jgi:hypothetical protein